MATTNEWPEWPEPIKQRFVLLMGAAQRCAEADFHELNPLVPRAQLARLITAIEGAQLATLERRVIIDAALRHADSQNHDVMTCAYCQSIALESVVQAAKTGVNIVRYPAYLIHKIRATSPA